MHFTKRFETFLFSFNLVDEQMAVQYHKNSIQNWLTNEEEEKTNQIKSNRFFSHFISIGLQRLQLAFHFIWSYNVIHIRLSFFGIVFSTRSQFYCAILYSNEFTMCVGETLRMEFIFCDMNIFKMEWMLTKNIFYPFQSHFIGYIYNSIRHHLLNEYTTANALHWVHEFANHLWNYPI